MENKTQTASQLIDKIDLPKPPIRPHKPVTYDMRKLTNPNDQVVLEHDAKMKLFNDYWESTKTPIELKKPEPLKKLVEVDILSVYSLFKKKYFELNKKYFDADVNGGESKILVFTLIYFFFRDEKFLKSPILNKVITEPSLTKGILVLGGFGCGKTSIFKTFRQMFFDAEKDKELTIKDIDGDEVHLNRYRRGFGYFSTNDAVQKYESCSNEEMKFRFWSIMKKGMIYFDDFMTERQASNYGKVELFKDILELRYDNKAITMGSMNYFIDEFGNTLDVNGTMLEMAKKYGNRVYDRMFEMFNIIELNGKSVRK